MESDPDAIVAPHRHGRQGALNEVHRLLIFNLNQFSSPLKQVEKKANLVLLFFPLSAEIQLTIKSIFLVMKGRRQSYRPP
jgi:hypothetical protein